MKGVLLSRRMVGGQEGRPVRRKTGPSREFVPLHDLTDCLLEAYDCVARCAYRKFLARGGKGGGELDDWLEAEREVLPELPAYVSRSNGTIYVLATLTGVRAGDVSIGVEAGWLVILAHSKDPKRQRAFCVLELPSEVDTKRSFAVLSNGMLAIRMPAAARAASHA